MFIQRHCIPAPEIPSIKQLFSSQEQVVICVDIACGNLRSLADISSGIYFNAMSKRMLQCFCVTSGMQWMIKRLKVMPVNYKPAIMVQKSLDRVHPNTTAMTRIKVEACSISGLDSNHLLQLTFSHPFILISR